MSQGDFRFSGANEFNLKFGVGSDTNSRLGNGRVRPRLTKLRRPKSSFVGQGAADLAYNPFRNEVNKGGRGNTASVFGWSSVADGKVCLQTHGSMNGSSSDEFKIPSFGVAGSVDKTSAAKLSNEFEKLNVGENAAPGSYFEFRSNKNGKGHDTESSNGRLSAGLLPDQLKKLNLEDAARDTNEKRSTGNFVFGTSKSSCGGLNGFTEAMLSKKMGRVCVEDRAADSNSGAAKDACSSHENFESGTNHGNKENIFFRGAGISSQENCGTGLNSSSGPSFSSSATNFCNQHETNSSQNSIENRRVGEGFCFIGKFDVAMSPYADSSFNRKVKFVPKRHAGKEASLKKKRENVKHNIESRVDPALCGQESASKECSSRLESPQPYSPMDMSPNPANIVNDQLANEAPMSSEKTFTQSGKFESSERNTRDGMHCVDECSVNATQQLNIGDNACGTNMDDTKGCVFEGVSKTLPEEFASGTETESFKSATEYPEFNTENSTSTPRKNCPASNSESDGTTNFYSFCNSEDTAGTKFTFTTPPSSGRPASVRRFKTTSRRKGFESYKSTATSKVSNAFSAVQPSENSFQDSVETNLTGSQLKAETESNTKVREDVNQESSGTSAATTVAQEACEKWRLRGNQAYANGDLSKAEEYYTRGVKCIPKSEKSRGCLRSLMLCYSNRAATRMSLGRLREAVKDCKLAAGMDPSFLRAHVRAANCYLALGEVEESSKYYKYCLQPGIGVFVDKKILKEASEGLQKAQKTAEGISRSIESIQRGTCTDAENALRLADEALTICLYSETLLEIKAEALFVLQKYFEVIKLCQDSLDSAERNSNPAGVTGRINNPNNTLFQGRIYLRLWRCHHMLKSYFFLGKLEEALDLLDKHESSRKGSETLESLIPFVATIRELLRYKAAGNVAFQSANYAEAIEHYSAALSFNVDSRPFTAICFCNRSAAYKALGKIIDSIADCNLAIALERDYLKAISRRATLFESIRDYGQAASDTERIVSLLKEQSNVRRKKSQEKSTISGIPIDLRQAQLQLSRLQEQAKKGTPLNMYLVLGIESSASASEIRKAYRQAALKHHPDKASQLLAKSDNGRNDTRKEISEEIHKAADRLFKLIGEAYTVLSDPVQRSEYDSEEEMRNMLKKNTEPFTSRTRSDAHYYPFQQSNSRRSNNFWRRHGYY
ncbi:unnamed protein product [Rhodiola kirilowii]